jgi:cellulose synthase/poly-beta-1,6-N-acetylglucosamine synthase-like glycosyltransferase
MNLPVLMWVAVLAGIVWVLIGYPLLLMYLARRPSPVRKIYSERTVSILLPVADGEAWVRQKLQSLLSLDYPQDLIEIIVVSDGSTDSTEDIVREFAGAGVKLLSIPKSGKAVALNQAMSIARGDILFFTDVRQIIEPRSLRHLVACLEDERVGVATGELFIREGSRSEESHVGLYWKYEKWIRKRLSAIDSIPGATGCIYVVRRELAVPFPPATLLDDVYLPLNAFFKGYRVVLEEQAKAYDDPTSLRSEFRRKIRTQAGVYQIIGAYPALLGPRNRMWIHFMSHKLGRLLLPFLLIAFFILSFWLPPAIRTPVAGAQVLFYLTAFLDRWIPERLPIKRFSSFARAFVILIAAALCAVSILFIPPHRLWKQTKPVQTAKPAM